MFGVYSLMPKRCFCFFVLVIALTSYKPSLSAQGGAPASDVARLGDLEIRILKFEQTMLVEDSFTGRSTYDVFGKIHVRFVNRGKSRLCVSVSPTVEEYWHTELTRVEPLTTGLRYNPHPENLKPGHSSIGYYDFKPSPQKRDYVLVLRPSQTTQGCGESTAQASITAAEPDAIRLPFPKD